MKALAQSPSVELGDILARDDTLTAGELARAKSAAAATGKRLDQALLELGLLSEARLIEISESQLGVRPYDGMFQSADLSFTLSETFASAASIVPVEVRDGTIHLAMVDPFDDFTAQAVALSTGLAVARLRITARQFLQGFESVYGHPPGTGEIALETDVLGTDSADLDVLRDSASEAPVIRLVQTTISKAVDARASDVHIRPMRSKGEILFRVDGKLERQSEPDIKLLPAILSRLKILANLDISERRLPQDGRIRVTVAGQSIDIRLSTMPQIHGEGAVLRILSRDAGGKTLADLGFSTHIEAGLERLFDFSEGLILVTGPTGSGKSTTLHAALSRLVRPELNVVTIEDPVEYRVDGASQIQIDERIGLTFPRVLRSVLRQDPDIILIGEIRDGETARIAVQAALTGHLVLATLHTNSATAAIPRMIDMGVEPYLLAAVLRGALAQRLVPRRCSACGGEESAKTDCHVCGGTGHKGRVAIGELAILDPQLVEKLARTSESDPLLARELREKGFIPLSEDANARAVAGEVAAADLVALLATHD